MENVCNFRSHLKFLIYFRAGELHMRLLEGLEILQLLFQVWLGPNAVLAFRREGYSWLDFSPGDLAEVLRYPGFYRVVE